jgi:hypothetical protein
MTPKSNVSIRLEEVHAEHALQILEKEMFSGQRARRHLHVLFLARLMRDGVFNLGTTVYFVVYAGKRYLVNGQHTLSAIVETGIPQVLVIHETLVTSEDDIAKIYARHDRGLQRTIFDGYRARTFASNHGMSSGQVNDFGGGLPLLLTGFRSTANYLTAEGARLRDIDFRLEAMEQWVAEAREFFEEISFSRSYIQSALRRQSVISVALLTYRFTGGDASKFWREVAKDNGLPSSHPAKQLIHFLNETPARMHSPRIYARYVASCWNADYDERSISKVYARDVLLPIQIKGTPFDGKQFMSFIAESGELLSEPVLVKGESVEAVSA